MFVFVLLFKFLQNFTFVHRSSNTFLLGNKKLQHNTLPIKKQQRETCLCILWIGPIDIPTFLAKSLTVYHPSLFTESLIFSNLMAFLTVYGLSDRSLIFNISLLSLKFNQLETILYDGHRSQNCVYFFECLLNCWGFKFSICFEVASLFLLLYLLSISFCYDRLALVRYIQNLTYLQQLKQLFSSKDGVVDKEFHEP